MSEVVKICQILCPKCKGPMMRYDKGEGYIRYMLSCDRDRIVIQSNYPIIKGYLPKEVILSDGEKEK